MEVPGAGHGISRQRGLPRILDLLQRRSEAGEGADVWGAKEAWDTDATGVDLYTTGPIKIFGREHQVMAGANGYQNSLVGRLH